MVHYFLSLFASILVFLPVAEAQDYRWKVDFNNDGYDDLAIGAPSTTVLGLENAGQVYILYGSDAGLKTSDVQIVRRGQLIDGEPFAGESVGANLQSGNFNCDQYTDLLVFESSIPNGGFFVLYGSDEGLRGPAVRFSNAGRGAMFGAAATAGDLNADGCDEAIVGLPSGGLNQRGLALVYKGDPDGLQPFSFDDQVNSQIALAGRDKLQVGAALATGYLNDD